MGTFLPKLYPAPQTWERLVSNEGGVDIPLVRVHISALLAGQWDEVLGAQLHYSALYMLWVTGIKQRVAEKRRMRRGEVSL
jgi:hypothetical protein